MFSKLEKLHKSLTVILIISTIVMGYFLFKGHQQNIAQEKEIKKLSNDIDSVKWDVDSLDHEVDDTKNRVDNIEGYLSQW